MPIEMLNNTFSAIADNYLTKFQLSQSTIKPLVWLIYWFISDSAYMEPNGLKFSLYKKTGFV